MRNLILSTAGVILTGGAAYLWYKLRSRTDTEAMRERARIQADQAPVQVLERALAARDAQVNELQGKIFTFMTNHLEHDKAEREHLAEVLSGMQQEQRVNVETLKELAADLKAMRDESAAGRGKLHESINSLAISVARIEGRS